MHRTSRILRPWIVAGLILVAARGGAPMASDVSAKPTSGAGEQQSVVPPWLSDSSAGVPVGMAGGPLEARLVVTDFGAVGDGIADDTAAIQAAVNAANADGGGIVFMPAGVYATSEAIYMRSNVVIEGTGDNTVILAAGDFVGLIYVGTPGDKITDTIVRDLTVRGSGNPGDIGNTLISMNRHVERGWIDHVWMDQAGYDSWNALLETRQVYVTRSRITGAGDDGLNPGGAGEIGQGSRDIVLSQNFISGVTNDGIHVSFNSSGVHASGNIIVDSGVGIGVFFSNHSTIKDNVIRNCGTGILNRAHGSHDLVISGNLIDSTVSGPGIQFGFEHQRVEISRNTILFPAEASAHGIEEIGGSHVTIRDNVIQGTLDGIRVTSGDHTVVVGNLVRQAQNGVVFDGSDGVVSGNDILEVVDRGIDVSGGDGQSANLVSGNVVRNVQRFEGIRVTGSGTAITGNHVFDVAGPSIEDLGSENTIANNYVDGAVAVTSTTRVVHIDADGRMGFGMSAPQATVDVAGDARAEAFRLGKYRIFAGIDGLYVEDLDNGNVSRVLMTFEPGSPSPPPNEGDSADADGIVEVERTSPDDR